MGRDKEKETVLKWLRNPSNEYETSNEYRSTFYGNISLLSIVGQGGIGKTILVLHVYKEIKIDEFDLKMWVCVSNNFNMKKVIADMLESTENESSFLTLDALQNSLESVVNSKKFLLVLDDIWEEEDEDLNKSKWENVLAPLASGKLGSMILVTTRMKSVALMLSKIIYKNKMLTLEQHRERETGSVFTKDFIGRGKEKEFVMNWLRETSNENQTNIYNNISLLSIVGQGGMGKTTLMLQVYKEEIRNEFDLKLWVCVSNNFNVTKVIADMVESTKNERPRLDTLNRLQETLKSTVDSKKFLLVLDDVWEGEDEELNTNKWVQVLAPLAFGKLGSKILVTTRMDSVAIMFSKIIHKQVENMKLVGLNDDECLQLLHNHAFNNGEDSTDYPQLRPMAKKIVKKLSGSPLAAKVIGGVLSSRLDETHWHRVLNYVIGRQKDIMDILKLSYIYLPKVLQSCFSFCCTFSQDYEFDKDDLVRMWIVLGFIQPDKTQRETMKDAGERYFDVLVQKSLFDKFGNKYDRSEYYKLHDLLHEIVRIFSTQECCSLVGDHEDLLSRTPKTIRHLFVKDVNPAALRKVEEFNHLRSLILVYSENHEDLDEILAKIFKILRTIRLIYINAGGLKMIPNEIADSIHLQYLRLKISGVSQLPASLPPFWQLPLLKYLYLHNMPQVKEFDYTFHGNDKVNVFPSLQVLHIERLEALEDWFVAKATAYECLFPCLTELHLKHCPILLEFPTGLPSKLQKLEIDSIGWKGSNWLQRISNYCSISIQHCPNLISLKGHQEIEIAEKCQLILSELTINDPSLLLMAPLTSVTSIKKLEIKDNDEVISFPIAVEQWFMQVSPSLCELVFYSLNSLQSLPSSLESLSSLKILSVEDVPLLQQLSNMPASLEQLNLAYLESLRSLPSSLESLSSLKILTVKNVPLCQLLPNMPASLEQLDLAHLESLQSLPSSLESLSSLKILSVEDVPLLQQLSNMPASLEQLNLAYLESLQSLPSSLESLSSLKILTVKNVPLVQQLPNMPASLKELKLKELKSLQCLPSTLSFSSLEHLYLKSIPLQELPDLPTSLCELYLSRLSKLNCLPSSLSSLKKLDLYYLPELQKLPNLPFSLKKMTIWDCHPKLYQNYLA